MAEKKRCAIYTRKSTEEGLEQDFNSLDAQREACAAYILSQAAEGWEQVDEHYDDGGWSGGKIERPALTQLLADVEAGRVDIIVVYKVDRLTRSLADFAKIVDILDAKEASFVSVTQAFNTTNSMGRLTLNVLLSFAQFEREVTGERIRDKIAASKKKGMWMGGPVPIGYRLKDRQLLVKPDEADIVRMIFDRYCAVRSIGQLADELAEIGVRTKLRTHKSGKTVGGIAFTKGPLANLLKNPIYTGKVRHKDKVYDGQHEAIIEQALWDEVQAIFIANGQDLKLGKKANNPSLLTGRLTDPDGRPMTPVHTSKGSKRYRYYVTRTTSADNDVDQWRVAVGELDRAAVRLVGQWFRISVTDMQGADVQTRQASASEYPALTVTEQRKILIDEGLHFALSDEDISITGPAHIQTQCVSLPARLVKQGHERKLALPPDGKSVAEPNPILLKLLAQARAAQRMVLKGTDETSVAHYGKRHLWQLLRISWLAPDIVSAIVDGNQPPSLTGRRLLRAAALPLDWAEQRQYLGFS